MSLFEEGKHKRGFHGRFASMGLSAGKLESQFRVKIHGLGSARQRYRVTGPKGEELGHVQRLSDNNFHAVHVNGSKHSDGPFPTRAMAGSAVADMHGLLESGGKPGAKTPAASMGAGRLADSIAQRVRDQREAAHGPARPRKHPNGPEPKADNGYEYKLVQKEPGRIDGTTQILKKYHVLRNGEKVGEIRHEKYYHQIMEGRLRAGLRHDFTAYQVHEGSSDYPRRVAHGGQAFTLKEAKDAAEKHFDAKAAERAAKEEPPKPSDKKSVTVKPDTKPVKPAGRVPMWNRVAAGYYEHSGHGWKVQKIHYPGAGYQWTAVHPDGNALDPLPTLDRAQKAADAAHAEERAAKSAEAGKPTEEPGDAARLQALRDQVETARVRQRMATDRRLDFNGIGNIDNPRGGWTPKLEAGLPRHPTEEQMRHASEQERNAQAGLRVAQRDMFQEALRQGKAYTIKEHDRLGKRPFEIMPADSIINAVGAEAYKREGQKIGVRVARYQTRDAAENAIREMTKKEMQRLGDEDTAIRAKSDDELKAAAHRDPGGLPPWPDRQAEEELHRRGYHVVDGQYHKVHDPNAPQHDPLILQLSRNLVAQPHEDEAYPEHHAQAAGRLNRDARETKERARRMFGMNPDITKHGEEGMPGKGQRNA